MFGGKTGAKSLNACKNNSATKQVIGCEREDSEFIVNRKLVVD